MTVVKKGHTKGKKDKKKKKKQQHSNKVVVSPSSSPTTTPTVTSSPPQKGGSGKNKSNNSGTAAAASNDDILEWERKRPAPRPKKFDGFYNRVEEVHYETGTLFLYRGRKHRRVEYIPRV